MKQAAEQFAPMTGTGVWKAEQDFFARGRSGEWKEKLSAAELAAFDAGSRSCSRPTKRSG